MDLRSRGGKGRRSFMDTLLLVCICLIGMRLRPGLAEEYSHYIQNTGLIGDTADSISSEQDTDNKRSSSFFPLRGKKPSLDTPEIPFRYPLVSSQLLEDKRSQFYPLRGKKIPSELKRASYFMPMRGRKDDQEWSEEEDNPEKRMSSFMPMRGRKDGDEAPKDDSLEKRMSSFMPMRGRKDDGDSLEKRMSSFMPMRGRKDDDESTEEDSLEKRMSSFMPMRGRKNDEDSLEKRMSSFMPMRGKKKSSQLMDSYMHLGKSGTYTKEILKSPSSSSSISYKGQSDFIPEYGNNPSPNNTKSTSSSENAPQVKKHFTEKRSVSFIPMRGKRSISEDQDGFLGHGDFAMGLVEKKRSSFMPMRGRRDVTGRSNESFLINLGDNGIEANSVTLSMLESSKSQINPEAQMPKDFVEMASTFKPMRRRRRDFQGDFDYETIAKDKRRRSQFMPMRGRRENEEDYTPNYIDLFGGFFIKDQSKKSSSFMAMRGRRSMEDLKSTTPSAFKHPSLIPIWVPNYGFGQKENTMDFVADNHTEDSISDRDDKRASYFMPMRGRRAAAYLYPPYPYHLPSGIGSSLMTRYFGGKMYPISPTWSAATKNRKFDWDSVKRAFHATRGKRFNPGDDDLTNINEKANNYGQMSAEDSNQVDTDDSGAFQDIEDELKELQNWAARETSSSEQDREITGKGCRCKRSVRSRILGKKQRQYIALKRPMSFFATRGKRMDGSAMEAASKIPLE